MPLFAFALPKALAATINVNLPGAASSPSSPGAWVANFYSFALMIAGVLAFAVIIYGGIRYMTSVGNPSGEEEAKEWIWAALSGILLLAGAYIILNVINPQLLDLNLPALKAVSTTAGFSVNEPTTLNGGATAIWGCNASNNVVACSPGNKSDCSDVPNGACNGKPCVQVSTSDCGQPATPTIIQCGAKNAAGVSQNGLCADSPNRSHNYCCDNNGTYSCQGTTCGATVCGSISATGTSQNGQCANSLNCCLNKLTGDTYSCQGTTCGATVCGSISATGTSQNGQCANSQFGDARYCLFTKGGLFTKDTYSCQNFPAGVTACGTKSANGTSQNGQCTNYAYKSPSYCCSAPNLISGVTFSCQNLPCGATACGTINTSTYESEVGLCPNQPNGDPQLCLYTKGNAFSSALYSCQPK